MIGSYRIITLCGSTRFRREFEEANKRLTLAGNIVIGVGLYGHAGDAEVWEGMDEDTLTHTKVMLDDMHKRKIDLADEIFVINVGGYVGSSTKTEVAYAYAHGKGVRYLEEPECVLESLEPATRADFNDVWHLYERVCAQSEHDAYSPRWTLGVYPTKHDIMEHINAHELYVGRVSGKVLAAMVLSPHEDPIYAGVSWQTPVSPNEVAVVHLLAVDPCLRGRHVGTELVNGFLRLVHEQGKRAIHLDVMPGNLAASRLYTDAGFLFAGTQRVHYEDTGTMDMELYEYAL